MLNYDLNLASFCYVYSATQHHNNNYNKKQWFHLPVITDIEDIYQNVFKGAEDMESWK